MQNVKMFMMAALPLLLSLPAGAVAASSPKPLKVFLLAGQSNMNGQAAVAALPANLKRPQKSVLVWNGSVWTPLDKGNADIVVMQLQRGKPSRTFGPEMTFGPAMARYFGQPIGIIKVAYGGTNLAVNWSPYRKHSLYARLVRSVKGARKARPIVIIGMIWMQGENDARHEAMAQAYKKNLTHLIKTARKDFGNPALPFVCGRITQLSSFSPTFPYSDTVRKAQAAIHLPAYRLINTDDLPRLNARDPHYNVTGMQELGKRFARAMIALLKQEKKAPK